MSMRQNGWADWVEGGKSRMHLLHLLRHAKSSWREDVEDHERPLNKRGRRTARLVGEHLPGAIEPIDLVLCSNALRTRQTLELALAKFRAAPPCLIEDGLYLADCDRLIGRLRQLDEGLGSVLLIGHNPGLHQLAAALAEPDASRVRALASGKFPTAARASFEISTQWSGLGDTWHRLVDYVTPASLPGGW
jgi:phosphohistidine phosphatase